MAENPTREGVGALGLFITGLPEGILFDEGDAMQLAAAAATGGCKGERSKSCAEGQNKSLVALASYFENTPRLIPKRSV